MKYVDLERSTFGLKTGRRQPMFLIAISAILSLTQTPDTDAVGDFLNLFQTHQVVAFSESHRSKECHQFLRTLIADSRFSTTVDDIVVEFGNPLFQDIADRYVSGQAVSPNELSKVWQNTTQWLVWDSPLYRDFYTAVRQQNAHRKHKIRVILGDSPIDWKRVQTADQFKPYATRDDYYFAAVDRLVAHGDHVMLVCGGMHLLKRDVRGTHAQAASKLPALADRYGSKYADIWTLVGDGNLAKRVGKTPAPRFIPVDRSGLANESSKLLLPEGVKFFRTVNGRNEYYEPDPASMPLLKDVIDGILVISPTNTEVVADPKTYANPAYVAELRRRAKILDDVFHLDFSSDLSTLVPQRS